MTVAEQVREAGQQVSAADGSALPASLNSAIGQVAGWPYNTLSGCVVDGDGNPTEAFTAVVCTVASGAPPVNPDAIPADSVAAVIDARPTLDRESLEAAYRHVAAAKRLRKSPPPPVPGGTNTTLGLILAQWTDRSLESLGDQLQRLNEQTPDREWPDMVAVASAGAIHYAFQFPGQSLSGDYLPPAGNALDNFTPPVYVVMVIRPTGANTFNRFLGFLLAHLGIFSTGAKVPRFTDVLDGVPQTAIVVTGYQYNLGGRLRPVPRHLYNDRYLPPLPFRIEDRKGRLLSTISYLPWQDGGVLILQGKLPLDGLMVFLGKEPLAKAGVVRPGGDLQLSYVLPIGQPNFAEMLTRLQGQSNMIVRRTEPRWTIQKFADEGTTSPFMARLFLGIMRLRDTVYGSEAGSRDKFDEAFDLVISALMNTRTAARDIETMWDEHARKVASGEIARKDRGVIRIDQSIDSGLRKEVETFLNAAVRTLKQGMQALSSELQINIGFMFNQQGAFDNGITALKATDVALTDYLLQTRSWSERLVQARNDVEHNGWTLPRTTYRETGPGIAALEPEISGLPVTQFGRFILDRLCCFVEEFTAHALQRRMPAEITITEVPRGDRSAEAPVRFIITPAAGGMPPWTIADHTRSFEES